ncbi:hypothetical protein SCLCIDRAFT_1225018, partial [Scleroderma citrinum Foug A]
MASNSEVPADLKALAAKVRAPSPPQLNIRITQIFIVFGVALGPYLHRRHAEMACSLA